MVFISKSFRTIVFVFIVLSQRFSRCILRLSSGVPCLSGHRNDSNFKNDFQVESFLCPDKLGTLEEGQRIHRPKHEKKIKM